MKSIIIGTAGHIDHGKTALVRALTGIDADRLPEEKRRGITIDIGFADLDLGELHVGFVDVPGHERFVKNMLAGAHGIDAVLLVIAADESVMPQTREHFDICRLLAVKNGLVVITKKDLIEEELLQLVRAETEEMVAGSFLESAPVIAVSSRTGDGIEELKKELRRLGSEIPARPDDFIARLPVDRAFTMHGFGAVVTGTLIAGAINEGDEMDLLPTGTRVRVRGLQVHGAQVKRAVAGQRTAVNLSGIEANAIQRGLVLAPPACLQPTQIIDARVQILDEAPRPLRSRQRLRVHLGAAEVLARVRVLETGAELRPGESGFVQLRFESPIIAVLGDRFIIRAYSPQRTIGGGVVLDPFAAKHRSKDSEKTAAALTDFWQGDRARQLARFVAGAERHGLKKSGIAARTAWREEVIEAVAKETLKQGAVVDAEGILVDQEIFAELKQTVLTEVKAHHQSDPLSRGLAKEVLRERHFGHSPAELWRAVSARLEQDGALIGEKDVVRLREHTRELSGPDRQARERLEQIYRDAVFGPPNLNDALAQAGLDRDVQHGRKILQLSLDSGSLVKVQGELIFHRAALDELTKRLRDYATRNTDRAIDVARFKELAGISRKYAIPLLEYLDRQRITRREGDRRVIL
jgi:selenocysteine-specific elongation factor